MKNINKMGYAVIGCGYVAKRHVEAIFSLPCAKVTVLCDADLERAKVLQQQFPGTTVSSDMEAVCAREDVHVVVICLPTFLHEQAVLMAARNGKHVYVEKPIALSVESARKMILACTEAGVKLCVGHCHRYIPVFKRAREIISSGRLGKVFKMRSVNFSMTDASAETRLWKLDPRKDLGSLVDSGIHYIDDFRFLSGKEIVSVYAHARIVRPEIFNVLDDGIALLQFEDSISAIWEMSDSQLAGVGPLLPDEGIEVYGTRGSLTANMAGQLNLVYLDGGGQQVIQQVQPPTVYVSPWNEFHLDFNQCIMEDSKSPLSGEEGLAALSGVLSILESAKSGIPVKPLRA